MFMFFAGMVAFVVGTVLELYTGNATASWAVASFIFAVPTAVVLRRIRRSS